MSNVASYYKRSYWQRLKRACEGCRLQFSVALCLFEEGYSLKLFGLFIPLTFLQRWHREPYELMESWGFTFCDRSLHLNWGNKCKIIYMPWMFEHIRHEVQRPDGSWVPEVSSWDKDKEPDGRHEETHPYHYMLDNGEVQHVNATIHVERREWRWRWTKRLPWPRKICQSIDVEFDGEVGERAGSWKGGCIGCSYEMKPGETPRETLMRMQRERRFR